MLIAKILPPNNANKVEEGGQQDGHELCLAHAEELHEGVLDEVAPPVPLQLGGAHVLHDVPQTVNAPHLWSEIQVACVNSIFCVSPTLFPVSQSSTKRSENGKNSGRNPERSGKETWKTIQQNAACAPG